MNRERLAIIKEHFKNPPSASCNREWALEVIEALERLMRLDAPAKAELELTVPTEPIPLDAPVHIEVEAPKKKGGRK